jgi:thiol-disulfide isomerase/thioredoxin
MAELLTLQSSDFNQLGDLRGNKGEVAFVLFYSPNCGHCNAFKPMFVNFSKQNPSIKFYTVNMAINSELSNKQFPFSLNAVPTTVSYVNNKPCGVISGNKPDVLINALQDAKNKQCCINSKCKY